MVYAITWQQPGSSCVCLYPLSSHFSLKMPPLLSHGDSSVARSSHRNQFPEPFFSKSQYCLWFTLFQYLADVTKSSTWTFEEYTSVTSFCQSCCTSQILVVLWDLDRFFMLGTDLKPLFRLLYFLKIIEFNVLIVSDIFLITVRKYLIKAIWGIDGVLWLTHWGYSSSYPGSHGGWDMRQRIPLDL